MVNCWCCYSLCLLTWKNIVLVEERGQNLFLRAKAPNTPSFVGFLMYSHIHAPLIVNRQDPEYPTAEGHLFGSASPIQF